MSKRLLLPVAALVALACTGCATGLTGAPAVVSDHDARIDGQVISDAGGEVEYWVEYGPTAAYGSQSPHQTVGTIQNQLKTVAVTISGLERATSYHYRFCAQDSSQQGGPSCGEDRRLKTQSFGCGETLTAGVRLTASMECVEHDPGLVIGAPGVDINLAGHRFIGIHQPEDELDTGMLAILNDAGYDDLTVRNGTLTGWGTGAQVAGGARTRLLNLDLQLVSIGRHASGTAADLSDADDSEIRHVHSLGGGFGIYGSARVIVADSSATGNGGVFLIQSDDARVVRNSFGPGDRFVAGISVYGLRNRIAENRVFHFGSGNIILHAGADNVIVDNEAFEASGTDGEESDRGHGDGIFVAAFTNGTVLRRNYAHDNSEDGIEVQGTGTRLADNRADDNGAWGIDAVAGVADLGGNTASGNGNQPQCRNVFCQ